MRKKITQQDAEKLAEGIRSAYETEIRRLNFRLDTLVTENRNLRAELQEYKTREHSVGKAIVAAEEKGEDIMRVYRMTAETELKTLQLFADKWKRLAQEMAGAVPQSESDKYTSLAENLSDLLGKERKNFEMKAESAQDEFDPKAVMQQYVEEESEADGFHLEDVINPKGELDLEKLCRGLGLMDEN